MSRKQRYLLEEHQYEIAMHLDYESIMGSCEAELIDICSDKKFWEDKVAYEIEKNNDYLDEMDLQSEDVIEVEDIDGEEHIITRKELEKVPVDRKIYRRVNSKTHIVRDNKGIKGEYQDGNLKNAIRIMNKESKKYVIVNGSKITRQEASIYADPYNFLKKSIIKHWDQYFYVLYDLIDENELKNVYNEILSLAIWNNDENILKFILSNRPDNVDVKFGNVSDIVRSKIPGCLVLQYFPDKFKLLFKEYLDVNVNSLMKTKQMHKIIAFLNCALFDLNLDLDITKDDMDIIDNIRDILTHVDKDSELYKYLDVMVDNFLSKYYWEYSEVQRIPSGLNKIRRIVYIIKDNESQLLSSSEIYAAANQAKNLKLPEYENTLRAAGRKLLKEGK